MLAVELLTVTLFITELTVHGEDTFQEALEERGDLLTSDIYINKRRKN